jgi:hypothetical protein
MAPTASLTRWSQAPTIDTDDSTLTGGKGDGDGTTTDRPPARPPGGASHADRSKGEPEPDGTLDSLRATERPKSAARRRAIGVLLRAVSGANHGYSGHSPPQVSELLPGGSIELSPVDIEALDVRWSFCCTPSEVASRLVGLATPWYMDGYVFDAAGSGRIWEDAAPDVLAAVHQTWLRDPVTDNYLLDVFGEPHDGDIWICLRDDAIRLPYSDIIRHTQDGIPYLRPSWFCCSRPGTSGRRTKPTLTQPFRTWPSLSARPRPSYSPAYTVGIPGWRNCSFGRRVRVRARPTCRCPWSGFLGWGVGFQGFYWACHGQ